MMNVKNTYSQTEIKTAEEFETEIAKNKKLADDIIFSYKWEKCPEELSEAVIIEIERYEGSLLLNKLKRISDSSAVILTRHTGSVFLMGLKEISNNLANILKTLGSKLVLGKEIKLSRETYLMLKTAGVIFL
jgi:hypothetical protein